MNNNSILFAIPELDLGGPDQVFFEVINFLAKETSYNINLLVTKEQGFYLQKLNKKVKILVIKRPLRLWSRYPFDGCLFCAFKLKPDIILTTLRMNLVFNIIYFFLPRKTKLITRIANDFSSNTKELRNYNLLSSLGSLISKILINNSNCILCQSKYMCKDMKSYIKDHSKIKYIYNPIATKVKIAKKTKKLISKSDLSLVSVGRLEYQKGFDILIKSFSSVIKNFPRAKLYIYGKGSQYNYLKKLIYDLSLSESIFLKGFNSDIVDSLLKSKLFLLASRYEGFSNALLEALSLGIPVVTTRCPGSNEEVIFNGENGFLAKKENPNDFSRKIIKALNHEWNYNQIKNNTLINFSKISICSRYIELFNDLLKS